MRRWRRLVKEHTVSFVLIQFFQFCPTLFESKLSDFCMPEADLALSQAVTQMPGTTTLSLEDDLLQSRHMTIADLLNATEECVGAVLVTVVELNMDQGWSYNSCNTCLKFVKLLDNKFTCGKCKTAVSASPRYKLNLQVIDETGSSTFTLFNTLVSNYVGRSAEDLIRANEQRAETDDPPVEFLSLIGRQFLFKVQVSDMNIRLAWQTYTVKKFTSEDTIIQKFLAHNNLLGSIADEEPVNDDSPCHLDEIQPVLALTAGDDKLKGIQLLQEFNDTISNENSSKSTVSLIPVKTENASQTPPCVMEISNESSSQKSVSVMPMNANDMGNPVFLSDAEVGESLNTFFKDLQETPPNKTPGKRVVSEVDNIDFKCLDFSPESAAKLAKSSPEDCSKK